MYILSYFEVEEPCKKEKEVIAQTEVIFPKENVNTLGGYSVPKIKGFFLSLK